MLGSTILIWHAQSGCRLRHAQSGCRLGQAHGKGSGPSEFLSGHGVQNLFLTTTAFQVPLLVESSTVAVEWGDENIAVNLSDMGPTQRQEWLLAAANFDGAVYLVDFRPTSPDDTLWWNALSSSHVSPPRILVFMYHCSWEHLKLALQKNKSIRNLTLFRVNLDAISSFDGISLRSLHLDVQVSPLNPPHRLQALCNVVSPPVNFSLAIGAERPLLVDEIAMRDQWVGFITMRDFEHQWVGFITNILRLPLTQLTLFDFIHSPDDLIDFIRKNANSSLHCMVLEVKLPSHDDAKATLVRAVVDALDYSGLPYLDLINLQDAAIEAQLLANQQRLALKLSRLKKEPAVAARLFICGDAYAGKTTLLSTLSSVCSQVDVEEENPFPLQEVTKKVLALIRNLVLCVLPSGCRRRKPFSHPGVEEKSIGSQVDVEEERPFPMQVLKKKALALIRRATPCFKQHDSSPKSERTRGIEVHAIMKDGIRLSAWDMAGQTEFHAFHDHMIPDRSSAMFLFVWSPIDSKSQERGSYKTEEAFEASFCYWLKFIASKTRQSNISRKIIVVLTRKDQTNHMQHAFADSIRALAARFQETIDVVKVMEVDARNPASVTPLASCIFETARDVLNGAEVYRVCSEMSKLLSLRRTQRSLIRDPIISWDAFSKLCTDKLNVIDLEVQKAIAYSLNASGDLIYLSNLPFLVLDPNWFCHEVMGSLIYFPHCDTFRGYIPKDGYFKQKYLEKILETSTHDKVKGSLLVDLLEGMNLCCKVSDDTDGTVFIPATLGEVSMSELRLQWRGATSASTQEYAYVGRRLECDRKDLTFLTPGLFPMIQVVFRKAFLESKADMKNGKGFMSICVEDIEIIVEFGLANAQHVIDVMVRTPDRGDVQNTLAYVEDEIIKTLIRVCAQREGNQGVKLVVGVIRPDCLWVPAPSHVREDQSVLILDLKREVRKKLEKGQPQERLVHLWVGNGFVGPVTNHVIDLLGFEEFMEVLMSYKVSLQDAFALTCQLKDDEAASSYHTGQGVSESSKASTSSLHMGHGGHLISDDSQMQEGDGVTNENLHDTVSNEEDPIVVALSKGMVRVIDREMRSMKKRLDNLQCSVDSMREEMSRKLDAMHGSIMELRNDVLPEIQRLVEQSLKFSIESEAGRVPRLGILTTENVGVKRRMVTALFKDLKSVHMELFCEHREGAHPVKEQKGLDVTVVEEGTLLRKALPYVNGFLRVLTVVAQVGAHVVAGLPGSTVPDLSKIVALVLDTPGFLDNQGFLAKTSKSSPGKAFSAWQQWLVSVLERNGGVTESNIASRFKLRRALYEDTSQVAWLCDSHYKQQRPLPLV